MIRTQEEPNLFPRGSQLRRTPTNQLSQQASMYDIARNKAQILTRYNSVDVDFNDRVSLDSFKKNEENEWRKMTILFT